MIRLVRGLAGCLALTSTHYSLRQDESFNFAVFESEQGGDPQGGFSHASESEAEEELEREERLPPTKQEGGGVVAEKGLQEQRGQEGQLPA